MLQVIDSLERLYEATHHTSKVATLRPLQRKLQPALAKAFRAQGKAFTKGLFKFKGQFPVQEASLPPILSIREALTDTTLDSIFGTSEDDTIEMFTGPLTDAISAALLAAGKAQIAELGYSLSFTLKNPRAVAYLKAHGAELVSKINDTTRSYIKTIITQAADEGWSYTKTAKAITDRYEEFAVGVPSQSIESRAERVAVTELGQAYCEGNFEPVQDLMAGGVEMEKKWDTAPELSKTGPCPEICQPNADEGWIPADQTHQSGDDTPLGHPGCYCDEYYQVKE